MLQVVRARGACHPRAIAARRGEAAALAAVISAARKTRSGGGGSGGQGDESQESPPVAAGSFSSLPRSSSVFPAAPRVLVPGPDGSPMEITLVPRRRRGGPAQAAAAGDPRVLRLRGLPFSATERDVAAFFEGFEVDERGKRRGESRGGEEEEGVGEEEAAEAASEAAEGEEGEREEDEEDDDEGEAEEQAAASAAAPVPTATSEGDNEEKEEDEGGEEEGASEGAAPAPAPLLLRPPFSPSIRRNLDSGVEIVMRSDGQGGITGSGVAFVRFASPEAADRARAAKHRRPLGNR